MCVCVCVCMSECGRELLIMGVSRPREAVVQRNKKKELNIRTVSYWLWSGTLAVVTDRVISSYKSHSRCNCSVGR